MEIRTAEKYYGSPRNYLYQMNRLTDESWARAQDRDNTGAPITLSLIEQAQNKLDEEAAAKAAEKSRVQGQIL